jgi:hypothetical protein
MQEYVPAMGSIAVLEEIEPLPRSETGLAETDRHRD